MASHRNDWRVTTALFAATGLVESLAFGHLSAFMPIFLRDLRVPAPALPFWTGALSSMGFVIGLPLLPFWGVWSERYGRKLIIVRSSVAGAVMFALAGLSSSLGMLVAARMLGGFVLGNTGVMMAVQSDITPREKLGRSVALVSAGPPVGMAIGPYLGGVVVGLIGVRALLLIDAALTALMAVVLIFVLREEPRPDGDAGRARLGVRDSLLAGFRIPAVRSIYLASFLVSFGASAAMPFVPLVVERAYSGIRLAETIGGVLTLAGLAMALSTPVLGLAGDRAGHRRVWLACGLLGAVALFAQGTASSIGQIAAWRAVQGVSAGGLGALGMVMLAMHTPHARRAQVLTLSLLPAQLSWFLGPLAGSVLATAALGLPFIVGSGLLFLGFCAGLLIPARPPSDDDAAGMASQEREPLAQTRAGGGDKPA